MKGESCYRGAPHYLQDKASQDLALTPYYSHVHLGPKGTSLQPEETCVFLCL